MTKKKDHKAEVRGVSDAELTILKHLWQNGPAGPSQLRAELADAGVDWAYTTVQTLLHRLLDKGAVSRTKQGVQQVYRAEVDADGLLLDQMTEFAERVGSASASSLVLNLVRGKRLTRRDITRLRSMLDDAEQNRGRLPEKD